MEEQSQQLRPAAQEYLNTCLSMTSRIHEYPDFHLENEPLFVCRNKSIVLAAVSRKGFGEELEDASEPLQDDLEVVTAAIISYPLAYRFASFRLRDDKELTMMAVQKNGNNLDWTTGRMQDDKDVVKAAIMENPNALEFASPRLRDDKELVLLAVRNYDFTIKYASESIRNLVGDGNPKEIISKALDADRLHSKLEKACTLKQEPQARKMKL